LANKEIAVGAGSSAIGLAPLLISPLEVQGDGAELEALPPLSLERDEICARLADAERRLVRDANGEAAGRSWLMHSANLAVNAGVLLLLGLGFHHWKAGAINGVLGTAVGEAMILSQPTGAVDALDRYRAGHLEDPSEGATAQDARTGLSWGIGWTVALRSL